MVTYLMCMIFLVVGTHAFGASISEQHPEDVIQYLWWVVGLFGLGITSISGGIAVWAIKTILKHDKEITAIRAGCVGHKRRTTDFEEGEE